MKKHLLFAFLCAFFVIFGCAKTSSQPSFALTKTNAIATIKNLSASKFNCDLAFKATNQMENKNINSNSTQKQTDKHANLNEKIEFTFQQKSFVYALQPNIKTGNVFNENFEINRYNRFENKQTRAKLLKQMLSAGFDTEIALNYIFPNLNQIVTIAEKNIAKKPQNASLTINTNSEKVFYITREKTGLMLDKTKLYNKIAKAYLKNQPLKFDLPIVVLNPTTYAQDFEKFTFLRGEFCTNIVSSSADRKHNIKNALTALNLQEILPGEVFSFNKIVGRRTQANGYRPAKIIVNNEFVEGLGGGVCQVSSTLYNSALLAGLKIVEANKHSKQVGYVKHGFDAMVNFGSSDLKFENTTSEKITIVTNFSSNKIRIRIFGADLNGVEYRLANEIVSTTEPSEEIKQDNAHEYADKVQYDDESFVLKKGSRGMEVKSYREKYQNGKLVEKQLLRYDKFKPQNTIIIVGTKARENTLNQ